MTDGNGILDSKGNPIKSLGAVNSSGKSWLAFRSLWKVVPVLIAGGLITAVVSYISSGNSLALEREKFAYAQAKDDVQLSIEYWLGPSVGLLTYCMSTEDQLREVFGQEAKLFKSRCQAEYIPANYQTFGLGATGENWSTEVGIPEDPECISESCREYQEGKSADKYSDAAVYAVVWNEVDIRAVDIEIRWAGTDKAHEFESRSYDKFVDLDDAEYKTERIGDLNPGEGVILPIAQVNFDIYEFEFPRHVIPKGPARFPVSVRFSAGSSLAAHELRTPAETTRIVDKGSPWVEIGG